MAYSFHPLFLEHDLPDHPETSSRLSTILAEWDRQGLPARLLAVPADPAPEPVLERIHDRRYLAWLQQESRDPPRYIEQDTYICAASYEAATRSAGASIACLQAVLESKARAAIALVRPPGHHARRASPMGFCLINNIACAAAWALGEGGLHRVLIFDFDVHHGNGTQDAFYDDPRLLYFSLHQRPLFPGTGSVEERGRGAGLGYNFNVPLRPGVGDASCLAVVEHLLRPAAERFAPEVILVSAGYDGHWREKLANLRLTVAGYTQLARELTRLADDLCSGRLLFVLEGGYDGEVLAACTANLAHVLLGEPHLCRDPIGEPPEAPRDDLAYIRSLSAVFGL